MDWRFDDVDAELYPTNDLLAPMPTYCAFEDALDTWKCSLCNSCDPDDLEEGPAFWVCRACGGCQKGLGSVVSSYARDTDAPPRDHSCFTATKRDKSGNAIRGKISYGLGAKRRYKREFYYKERLAQWCAATRLSHF